MKAVLTKGKANAGKSALCDQRRLLKGRSGGPSMTIERSAAQAAVSGKLLRKAIRVISRDRRMAAIHEAGHMVVASSFGALCQAWIVPVLDSEPWQKMWVGRCCFLRRGNHQATTAHDCRCRRHYRSLLAKSRDPERCRRMGLVRSGRDAPEVRLALCWLPCRRTQPSTLSRNRQSRRIAAVQRRPAMARADSDCAGLDRCESRHRIPDRNEMFAEAAA